MKQAIMNLFKQKHSHLWILVSLFTIVFLLSACEILDKEPLDSIYQDEVWNSPGFVNMYLNDLYLDFLPEFPFSDPDIFSQEGLSDETQYNSSSNDNLKDLTSKFIYGELLKDDVDYLNRDFYSKMAKINRLLQDIETGSIAYEEKQLIKAQALFLRAYGYWEQVK